MIKFTILHPRMTEDHLGMIPLFLSNNRDKPAKDQIDDVYQHGGGWQPVSKFKLVTKFSELEKQTSPFVFARKLIIKYPGDPEMRPLAVARLLGFNRDETIVVYEHSWVAIFQLDYTFEIARID